MADVQPVDKLELIEFLEEYGGNYDVRVIDEDGRELKITALEWANGPWIIVEEATDG